MKNVVRGTAPPGTHSEAQASRWVQQMFSSVAPRYDLLNHLLSFNIDRGWRRHLLRRVSAILDRPDAAIVDICCGTGDVLLALQSKTRSAVTGLDFCHPMLVSAKAKIAARHKRSRVVEGDALNLPLRSESADLVSIAFGFRNLTSYQAGLAELRRILKPGGTLAILEFSHPPGFFMRKSYQFYSRGFLPLVGGLISGSREAYTYLPDSIEKFPDAEALRQMMIDAGFTDVGCDLLTGGVAALHLGRRAV